MIRENILRVKERIAAACARARRSPAEITLVAVSKGRGIAEINQAIACGISDIGENRLQEALEKIPQLSAPGKKLRFHLVGHLQQNKVKDAVRFFELIHSVDSLELAKKINKQAARINKVQDILLQVNTSGESSKFGLKPGEAEAVAKEISRMENIGLKGLMTIAPLTDDSQSARPYFGQLKHLFNQLADYHLILLSMGMTDDFEIAIEEGANLLRIGRAIFE